MKVVVWCAGSRPGAAPDEADSLTQAAAVSEALAERGLDAELLLLDPGDLPTSLRSLGEREPEVVFQLIEEVGGNAAFNALGALFLEALEVPSPAVRRR